MNVVINNVYIRRRVLLEIPGADGAAYEAVLPMLCEIGDRARRGRQVPAAGRPEEPQALRPRPEPLPRRRLTSALVRWSHVSDRCRRGPRSGGPSSPRRAAPLGARPGRAGAPRGVPRGARVPGRRGAAARHRARRRRRVRRRLRGVRRGRLRRRRRTGRQQGAQADRRPRGLAEVHRGRAAAGIDRFVQVSAINVDAPLPRRHRRRVARLRRGQARRRCGPARQRPGLDDHPAGPAHRRPGDRAGLARPGRRPG